MYIASEIIRFSEKKIVHELRSVFKKLILSDYLINKNPMAKHEKKTRNEKCNYELT